MCVKVIGSQTRRAFLRHSVAACKAVWLITFG